MAEQEETTVLVGDTVYEYATPADATAAALGDEHVEPVATYPLDPATVGSLTREADGDGAVSDVDPEKRRLGVWHHNQR